MLRRAQQMSNRQGRGTTKPSDATLDRLRVLWWVNGVDWCVPVPQNNCVWSISSLFCTFSLPSPFSPSLTSMELSKPRVTQREWRGVSWDLRLAIVAFLVMFERCRADPIRWATSDQSPWRRCWRRWRGGGSCSGEWQQNVDTFAHYKIAVCSLTRSSLVVFDLIYHLPPPLLFFSIARTPSVCVSGAVCRSDKSNFFGQGAWIPNRPRMVRARVVFLTWLPFPFRLPPPSLFFQKPKWMMNWLTKKNDNQKFESDLSGAEPCPNFGQNLDLVKFSAVSPLSCLSHRLFIAFFMFFLLFLIRFFLWHFCLSVPHFLFCSPALSFLFVPSLPFISSLSNGIVLFSFSLFLSFVRALFVLSSVSLSLYFPIVMCPGVMSGGNVMYPGNFIGLTRWSRSDHQGGPMNFLCQKMPKINGNLTEKAIFRSLLK